MESVELTRTLGVLQAEIIAGRLRAEGIAAWTWQEGAGSAHGLLVGELGFGHVMVPQSQLQLAKEILQQPPELPEAGKDDADVMETGEADTGDISPGSKVVLLGLALGVDHLVTLFTLGVSLAQKWFGSRRSVIVVCPHCGNDVELDKADLATGAYDCPFCAARVATAV